MSELVSFIESQKRKLEQEKASISPSLSSNQDRGRKGYTADYRDDDSGISTSPHRNPKAVEKEPEFGGLNLGGYEKVQQKLRKERQEEYRKHLAEKNLRSTGRADPVSRVDDRKSPFSGTPGRWAIAAAVVRFSQSIERYGRLGGDVHKTEPKEDIFTLLEQIAKERTGDTDESFPSRWDQPRGRLRDKENWDVEGSRRDGYNTDPPYRKPENAFETYEEKLRKKRAQEKRYRGSEDPYFDDDRPMRLTAPQYKYSSRSEGSLNRRLDYSDDYEQGPSPGRYRGQRDRRLQESKRVRFHDGRDDDEVWAKPPRRRLAAEYDDDEEDLFEWSRSQMRRPPRQSSAHEERFQPKEDLGIQSSRTDGNGRSQSAPLETDGGLFGGSPSSSNTKQKRNKEQYRKELQAQMEEQKEMKKRANRMRLGIEENGTSARETTQISPVERQPSTRFQQQQQYQQHQQQQQPRPQQQQQQQWHPQPYGLAGDNYGFGSGPLDAPSLYPGLYNDPLSMYMQGGMNQGPLYGGTRTPGLPGYGGLDGGGFGGTSHPPAGSQQMDNQPSNKSAKGSPTPVGGPVQTSRHTLQPPGGQTSFAIGGGGGAERSDVEKKRAAQQAYQEELKRQMEIKEMKKKKEKEELERYEMKKNAEIAQYDPWGRGGAGAPLKDSAGHAITDLRSMHQLNKDGTIVSPRDKPPKAPAAPETQGFSTVAADTNTAVAVESPRGGAHVGFGRSDPLKEPQPQDEAKRIARQEYQEYLKKQVEENEKRKREEQEKIKREDELQERRMEEQRKKIEMEYEKEQAAAREKEEAVRRKNEEQKEAQEAKKRETERKRKEMEEQRQAELRRKLEEELAAKKAAGGTVQQDNNAQLPTPILSQQSAPYVRTDSPPVPGVRKRLQQDQESGNTPRRSPPIPALASQQRPQQEVSRYPTPPPIAGSGRVEPTRRPEAEHDVLSQLTNLRQQLKTEEDRIQSEMQHSTAVTKYSNARTHVDVSPARRRSAIRRDVDVFERALSNRAAASKRDTEAFSAADEFNRMKAEDTSSLAGDFRTRFPVAATTASTLDLQQREYLREQEDRLSSLRKGGGDPRHHPQADGPGHQVSRRPGSKTSMLESDSQFLAMGDSSRADLPPESMGIKPRQLSARQRRRLKQLEEMAKDPKPYGAPYKPPTPGGFSLNSVTSFNADELGVRNDERLRRLQSTQKDGGKSDPDEILKRFMQERQRPPTQASEASLEAETSFQPI